jgi:hypothetical protein
MGEKKNVYKIFARKPRGGRPHGTPWEDNVKINVKEIGH